jgi:hypothetical protein
MLKASAILLIAYSFLTFYIDYAIEQVCAENKETVVLVADAASEDAVVEDSEYLETHLSLDEKELLDMCKLFVGDDDYKLMNCFVMQLYAMHRVAEIYFDEFTEEERNSKVINKLLKKHLHGGSAVNYFGLHMQFLKYLDKRDKNGK